MTSETAVGSGALATPDECAALSIAFSSMTDNTSELPRRNIFSFPPKRRFEVTMVFSTRDGDTAGQYLNANDTIIPYVPQPPRTKSLPDTYGVRYVYVALSYSLLDTIKGLAVIAGYKVELGDGKLLSTTGGLLCHSPIV